MNNGVRGYWNLGYEKVTGLSVAKGLTVPPGTAFCLIQTTGNAVRWRDDGTAPTVTDGMPLAVGAELEYSGQLTRIQFIESAVSAELHVSYYG